MLATAWELESAEKYALLLQTVFRKYTEQYAESIVEASFFKRLLVKHSRQQLEDNVDFTIATYTHDLAAYHIADEQLNHLEEIGAERELHLPLDDATSADAEVCLDECLSSILQEMNVSPSYLER
jgi:hypothetical protein